MWDIAATEPEVIAEPEDSEPVVETTSSLHLDTRPAGRGDSCTQPSKRQRMRAPDDAGLRVAAVRGTFLRGLAPAASQEAPGYEPNLSFFSEPSAEIEVSVSGRVQVRISPVPDFDRLLNLDGALGRVSGVDSVTLADYAQEEVTFRVEVLGEKDAGLFTREIAVAAGVEATLVDAADNGLVLRIN